MPVRGDAFPVEAALIRPSAVTRMKVQGPRGLYDSDVSVERRQPMEESAGGGRSVRVQNNVRRGAVTSRRCSGANYLRAGDTGNTDVRVRRNTVLPRCREKKTV